MSSRVGMGHNYSLREINVLHNFIYYVKTQQIKDIPI